jgi:hypothetical protein
MPSKILSAAGAIVHFLGHCFPRFASTRRRSLPILAATQARRFTRASGLSKTEAEELLDCLEAHGVHGCQILHQPGEGFTVLRTP